MSIFKEIIDFKKCINDLFRQILKQQSFLIAHGARLH